MSSAIGRTVIAYKANKSGGTVIKGDTVINDTSNDNAFTTTTSAAYTGGVWIADETIPNNSTGRVIVQGHASLVNVSASVTRGHTGTTHTVAKQTVSTGATTRTAGTFCRFTTGGTTPEADIWPVDLLGSSLTNPMTHVGALIYGGTAGAPTELQVGATGKVLASDGTNPGYAYPPGYEFDYVQITAGVNVTANTVTGTDIVVGNAVTYDGSTRVKVEFFAYRIQKGTTFTICNLKDGTTDIGRITYSITDSGVGYGVRYLTPSAAAHTYKITGFVDAGTGVVYAGAAGSADYMPAFIRITKA